MTQRKQVLVLSLRPAPSLLVLASTLHALVWAPLSIGCTTEAEGEHSSVVQLLEEILWEVVLNRFWKSLVLFDLGTLGSQTL